jgi:hypothetical protein
LVDNQVEEKKDEQTEASQTLQREKGKQVSNETSSSTTSNSETPYEPRAPFLERLKAPFHFGKQGEKIQEMMKVFKQVKINIPLLYGIQQVPTYAKFLKDLCTQKGKPKITFPRKSSLLSM